VNTKFPLQRLVKTRFRANEYAGINQSVARRLSQVFMATENSRELSRAEGQLALVRDVMASAISILHLHPHLLMYYPCDYFHVTFLPSSDVSEDNKTCSAVYKAT
jgi:hypothetical protein